MQPSHKRAQRHQKGASQYRGGDGPLHVSEGSIQNELYQAFIDAGVQAGYPHSDDLNGYQQEGFGRLDMTVNPQKVLSCLLTPFDVTDVRQESSVIVQNLWYNIAVTFSRACDGVLHQLT